MYGLPTTGISGVFYLMLAVAAALVAAGTSLIRKTLGSKPPQEVSDLSRYFKKVFLEELKLQKVP